MKRAIAIVGVVVGIGHAGDAWGLDAGELGGKPIRLDVTETMIAAQHFDAREGENPADHGYGAWLNRLNLALSWSQFTVGTRLDSSVYWLRPIDLGRYYDLDLNQRNNLLFDEASRYRNQIYPAKIWGTYTAPGLEV